MRAKGKMERMVKTLCQTAKRPARLSPIASNNDAETRQPVTPPAGTADSTNLPDSPVVPLA